MNMKFCITKIYNNYNFVIPDLLDLIFFVALESSRIAKRRIEMKDLSNTFRSTRKADRTLRLGSARRLTRATFVGEDIEAVPSLRYDQGV